MSEVEDVAVLLIWPIK